MPFTRFLPLSALILLGGCVYGVHERADQIQCDLSLKPYDLAPPSQAEPTKPAPGPEKIPAPSPAPTAVPPRACSSASSRQAFMQQYADPAWSNS